MNQLLCVARHDLLLKGGIEGIPLDAEHIQEVQGPELIGKIADLVVEQVKRLEVGAHADLGRQLRDEIVGRVQVPQMAQPADLGGEIGQSVGRDVEFLQELVGKQGRCQDTQPLAAHVEVVPVLPLVGLFQAPRPSPVVLAVDRGPGFTGAQSGTANTAILGRLKPRIEVGLVLLSHSGMRPFRLLVQPQLLRPVFGKLLCLASPGRRRVAVLQVVGEGTGIWQDAAREGRMTHNRGAAMVLLDTLMVLRMGLVGVGGLLLEVVQHGHALLPARRPIDTGVVPLLVVLAVHAARILARGAVGGRLGMGGGEMGE
jgi:hypothetical protein